MNCKGRCFTAILLFLVGQKSVLSEDIVLSENAEEPVGQESVLSEDAEELGWPYDFLYREGVNAYLEEDWKNCADNLEKAIRDWHWWNDNVAKCRRNCHRESEKEELFSAVLTEEDRFYERTIRSTLCLVKCKKDVFGSRQDRIVEGHVNEDFNMRKPYDYLQLCYYKLGRVKEAADGAATVLASQPDHEVMATNLRYYLDEADIDPDTVTNLEMKDYGQEYMLGVDAYDEQDYRASVAHMERSLLAFYEAVNDCRFACEKPFDQGWFPDFVSSVANHYTFTLRCKRQCLWQLSNLYGKIDDDFYPTYFNYLQYSYYQSGLMQRACEAAETYLLLRPDDEMMNRNKQYYLVEEKVDQDYFVPRKDAMIFQQREEFEEKLMDYIETSFAFLAKTQQGDEDEDEEEKRDVEGETSVPVLGINNTSLLGDLDTNTVVLATDTAAKDEF